MPSCCGKSAAAADLPQARGLLRGLFADAEPDTPGNLNLEDVSVSLEERVAEWPKPYIQQGISVGREQGISVGMEHERRLLRRMAAARFDSATADRLAAAIGTEADPQRLEEVGVAIVRCATGAELLRESAAVADLPQARGLLRGLFAVAELGTPEGVPPIARPSCTRSMPVSASRTPRATTGL